MTIQKIMERESARKQLDEIKLKICGIDLEALCKDENVKEEAGKLPKHILRALENAWMCGLVYFDNEEKCIVQKLIKPLKQNELACDAFYYKNELSLKDTKGGLTKDGIENLITTLSLITARPVHLIENLKGQDVDIAMACVGFFDM